MSEKIDINHLTPQSGKTALMLAAERGHIDCCNYLLKYLKADPKIRDLNGKTALDLARDKYNTQF